MSKEDDLIEELKMSALDERMVQRAKPTSDREADTLAALGRMMLELDQAAHERIALWVVSKYGA